MYAVHGSRPGISGDQFLESVLPSTRPGLGGIFTTLLTIGIQSFGGGSSTFYLIHQTAIDRKWLSEEEFIRAWALAQIAPGINLVKFTVMLGYRLRGWMGVCAAMTGLLLPSAVVTILMTAGFTTISSIPLIQSMMKGILPAAIGLSLAMGVQMAQPIFGRAIHEGTRRIVAHIGIMLCAALLLAAFKVSPVAVLVLAGVAAIVLFWLIPVGNHNNRADRL
jgi:chromate transporter